MTLGDQPAFPTDIVQVGVSRHGMTLRQWYAGMALQGLCTMPDLTIEQTAKIAAEQADALLVEQEKTP